MNRKVLTGAVAALAALALLFLILLVVQNGKTNSYREQLEQKTAGENSAQVDLDRIAGENARLKEELETARSDLDAARAEVETAREEVR